MATIVIHAGMPKAGSSAIQEFLRRNADAIATQGGTQIVVFRRARPGAIAAMEDYTRGAINSGAVWFRYLVTDRDRDVFDRFFRGLRRATRAHGRVLLTSEAFATPLAEAEPVFLEGLRKLTGQHEVRIAYYVRAQHESLEAAWRQWGFRSGQSPSAYVRERSAMLDYEATARAVAELAPAVSFEVRRFAVDRDRPDELIRDFAAHYLPDLPVELAEGGGSVNTGLPLDVVNVLRHAPDGALWASPHDNELTDAVKSVFSGAGIVDSPAVTRSRELLHAHCYARFEPGNRRVAEAMGWTTPHLIEGPVPEETAPDDAIERLDDLWASRLDAAERAAFFDALERAIDGDPGARTEAVDAFDRGR